MRMEHPWVVAAFLLGAIQTAGAEPAMWLIERGASKVILFGAGPPTRDTEWVSSKIDGAIGTSSTFWRETPDQTAPGANTQQFQRVGMDPEHPLSTKLDDANYQRLVAIAAELQLDVAQIEPMQPWLAANMLSGRYLARAGFSPSLSVDRILTDRAKANNIPIQSEFSTMEDMLRYFEDMPAPLAVDFLAMTLDSFEGPSADRGRELAEWLDGDLAIQERVVLDVRAKYPALYAYLTARNEAWVPRIEEMLSEPTTTFIVVGINHLVGPDSIQMKLQQRGIPVRRY